ncbi:protein DENND6A-like [Hydractinia symbiolongicarpus]|uniref:protein DENND6A-like n=1 Tax=Hydractinia symbiolongicarpus TaxID=13093 RepID=UPI00254AC31E|nr:protein DENND6A-like [Hydractinia symbiolongicarpus]
MACAENIDGDTRLRHSSAQLSDFGYQQRPSTSQTIPWDGFSSWISCFCVVTFDLELGQVIEKIYPEHCNLSDTEKANICYLAFPDSNTGCMGDTQFHFRIRSFSHSIEKSSKVLDTALQKDKSHYYGFVSFRQVKDSSIKRGYFQKSVVLLTQLPYISLFRYLVKNIAPEYFLNGEVALETVCYQIDKWPSPYPGQTLQLPVIGEVLQIAIPQNQLKGVSTKMNKAAVKRLTSSPLEFSCIYQPQIYECFSSMLPHLHVLWELVLLAEPIIVMAPSPSTCSEGVLSLVSLVQPLAFVCDHRPYFTIHDSELKEYTTKTQAPPKVILGVTNPFFAKTFQQWPHIVRIGDMPSLTIMKNGKRSQDLKPGIYTKYKACLDRDKAFLKKFGKSVNGTRPFEVQNAMLINYMTELTQSFMIPLERYIGSLMPLQRSISPWKSPPKLHRFNTEEFMQTLSTYGPQLTSKMRGNWQLLYRKFFKSPNFEAWFYKKTEEVNYKLDVLHIEALCQADIEKWLIGKDEVEIVDLYMQMKKKLIRCRNLNFSSDIRNKLHLQMKNVLKVLPLDLQGIIRKSL